MSAREWKTPGVVLSRKPSGENHQWLRVLSPRQGLVSALQRMPGKTRRADCVQADLFDSLDLVLQAPKTGAESDLFFVKAAEIRQRRTAIGGRYDRLVHAVEYAGMLIRNATHLEAYDALFHRAETMLDAFADSPRPDVVLFKALFLFARDEGFPAKESWWNNLGSPRRAHATDLINQPAADVALDTQATTALLESLKRWLNAETDIQV